MGDEWINEWICGWRYTNDWIYSGINGWMDTWMDNWGKMLWTGCRKGGRVDRWMTDEGGMAGLRTDG